MELAWESLSAFVSVVWTSVGANKDEGTGVIIKFSVYSHLLIVHVEHRWL